LSIKNQYDVPLFPSPYFQVAGISIGHSYDQMPFVKTLFKRLSTRMNEIPAASLK
jgi:hypothetical protein